MTRICDHIKDQPTLELSNVSASKKESMVESLQDEAYGLSSQIHEQKKKKKIHSSGREKKLKYHSMRLFFNHCNTYVKWLLNKQYAFHISCN